MTHLQQEIARALHVQPVIDPDTTVREIVSFLSAYLLSAGANGYVLGISGGQDSSLCGKLAQLAVVQARAASSKPLAFWAMRLPHGRQQDEDDAQMALAFIQPDHTVTVDIQPAVTASAQAIERGTGEVLSDYHRGNIKARERMVAQYALAGARGLLVLGTDHAAEAVTGFFTKHGDGACDLAPLTGLTKRQGKLLLQALHAPARLYEKTPTADLEDLKPLVPDEVALGLSYEQIDNYLEGKPVEDATVERLEALYLSTQHKRSLAVTRFADAAAGLSNAVTTGSTYRGP